MECKALRKDGSSCRAKALRGKDYCALHQDPGRAAEMGSRGGRRRALYNADDLEQFEPPRSAEDLLRIFSQCIVDIRAGKLDPKCANSISYLGSGYLRALEDFTLERRIEELERQHRQAEAERLKEQAEKKSCSDVYRNLVAEKARD